ncbi:hypothetical protein SCHIN_v1c01480 [Spiroplasma chinense]|uniref:Uncharacterized protein n=1 Tax=Spiroplasma chinense TaxID=216932 RepID=A0A5B9Y3U8_9MOLU|nr:hypothetical protein [Spiroplasma chinense]QEH61346.1 hypothetical protein SCHIN_v1c01480 [Spiroplasma chinense]
MQAEKIKKVKSNTGERNFRIIFNINLKLSLKNPGIIIGIILHVITCALTLAVETFLGLGQSDSLYVYRMFFYVFGSATTIFLVMVGSIYLFKRQVNDGIHSIELRAGFRASKSFSIRLLVLLTISLIANAFVLMVVFFLHLVSPVTTELMVAFGYSQVCYLIFLSIVSILIITFLFTGSKTVVATLLTTVFMFVVALSPLFASIKYMIADGDAKTTNYGLKVKALKDYTDLVAGNSSEDIKDLYTDKLVDGKSQIITSFQKNLDYYKDDNIMRDKLGLPYINYEGDSNKISRGYEGILSEAIMGRLVAKTFKMGQWNYDYSNIQLTPKNDEEKVNPTYTVPNLLEGTQLKVVLEKIYDAAYDVYADTNGTSNRGTVSKMFAYQSPGYFTSYPNQFSRMNISNVINSISREIPEYRTYLNSILTIYNRYEQIWNTTTGETIFAEPLKIEWITSTKYDAEDFYTPDLTLDSGYGDSSSITVKQLMDRINQVGMEEPDFKYTSNKEIEDKNYEIAELYYNVPELTIINNLIINLWLESFSLTFAPTSSNSEVLSDIYGYFNATNRSKALTTDIFRHFGAMSSGVLSDPFTNDIYNGVGTAIIYQGRLVYVKNIFNFEQDFLTKQDVTKEQKLFLEGRKLKYSNSFIIPLAFFVYLLISSPLAYLAYLIYERKSKI